MQLQLERIDHGSRGFTLIELAVVMGVIGLLAVLILSAVQSSREASRRLQCANNLKQIGVALANYHSSASALPPAYVTKVEDGGNSEQGHNWGWGALILGQMEQSAVYNSINFSSNPMFPPGYTIRQVRLAAYLCPSSRDYGPVVITELDNARVSVDNLAPGNYISSAGTRSLSRNPFSKYGLSFTRQGNDDGVMFRNSTVRYSDVTDGTGQTILIGERSRDLADATWVGTSLLTYGGEICTRDGTSKQECVAGNILVLGHTGPENGGGKPVWVDHPNYRASGADGYSSRHSGGCNFLFCDGSVRFIKESITPRVFGDLATRRGGEIIGGDQF